MTGEALHLEYIQQHYLRYARSRFNNAINTYFQLSNPVMHIDHKSGDKMYIEFVGSKLKFHPADGHQCDAEVFVAILVCCQLTYVEAIESQ